MSGDSCGIHAICRKMVSWKRERGTKGRWQHFYGSKSIGQSLMGWGEVMKEKRHFDLSGGSAQLSTGGESARPGTGFAKALETQRRKGSAN